MGRARVPSRRTAAVKRESQVLIDIEVLLPKQSPFRETLLFTLSGKLSLQITKILFWSSSTVWMHYDEALTQSAHTKKKQEFCYVPEKSCLMHGDREKLPQNCAPDKTPVIVTDLWFITLTLRNLLLNGSIDYNRGVYSLPLK